MNVRELISTLAQYDLDAEVAVTYEGITGIPDLTDCDFIAKTVEGKESVVINVEIY